jgi:hypothetical protein
LGEERRNAKKKLVIRSLGPRGRPVLVSCAGTRLFLFTAVRVRCYLGLQFINSDDASFTQRRPERCSTIARAKASNHPRVRHQLPAYPENQGKEEKLSSAIPAWVYLFASNIQAYHSCKLPCHPYVQICNFICHPYGTSPCFSEHKLLVSFLGL